MITTYQRLHAAIVTAFWAWLAADVSQPHKHGDRVFWLSDDHPTPTRTHLHPAAWQRLHREGTPFRTGRAALGIGGVPVFVLGCLLRMPLALGIAWMALVVGVVVIPLMIDRPWNRESRYRKRLDAVWHDAILDVFSDLPANLAVIPATQSWLESWIALQQIDREAFLALAENSPHSVSEVVAATELLAA